MERLPADRSARMSIYSEDDLLPLFARQRPLALNPP